MEKTYLSTNRNKNINGKLWDYKCLEREEDSWPSKYYRCSFCKREFRSAQALGGHMNVHRKDRARLKFVSSSSWLFQPQNPNPNSSVPFYFIPSPSALNYSLNYSHQYSLLFPSPSPSSPLPLVHTEENYPLIPQLGDLPKVTSPNFVEVEKLKSHAQNYDLQLAYGDKDSDQDVLDLELRLGYF